MRIRNQYFSIGQYHLENMRYTSVCCLGTFDYASISGFPSAPPSILLETKQAQHLNYSTLVEATQALKWFRLEGSQGKQEEGQQPKRFALESPAPAATLALCLIKVPFLLQHFRFFGMWPKSRYGWKKPIPYCFLETLTHRGQKLKKQKFS